MPYRTITNPEDNPVLVELLRRRLASLSYLAFAKVMRRFFRHMGLVDVELLGRRYERGRTSTGGADLAGVSESAGGRHMVLIQIKRYSRAVPRHFIDELRSVMLRRHVPQSISVTTGVFSPTARAAAEAYPGRPIQLFDGTELAKLMATYRIGIREQTNLVSGHSHWTIDEEAFQALRRECLYEWAVRTNRSRRGTP